MTKADSVGKPDWSRLEDVQAKLRRRWSGGIDLSAFASGLPFQPIGIPLRGPTGSDLLVRLDEVRSWVDGLEAARRTSGGRDRFRLDYRTLGGRSVGRNRLPSRLWLDSFEQLWRLLGTGQDVTTYLRLLEQTRNQIVGLEGWVLSHPQLSLEHAPAWRALLDTVEWIAAHEPGSLYLRQIDSPGVDTKFVESHRSMLAELLEQVLPMERIDQRFNRADFVGRFGFRRKPDYTRFRLLVPQPQLPTGVTELTLRTEELAAVELDVDQVFIVENEISYLAFPAVDHAVVIFGSGFALTSLKSLLWLADKEIVYWGDIDTHGFAIMNQLRSRFAGVRSILMDAVTLLAHERQWVAEPAPTRVQLPHLTEEEGALYRDLVEDRYGTSVRLEQERIRFSLVRAAVSG